MGQSSTGGATAAHPVPGPPEPEMDTWGELNEGP